MARRALDYLVGFNISPILWTKLPGSKSAGRVQSVALKLITEREHEIELFKPEEFWTLSINFQDKNKRKITASISQLDGEKIEKFSFKNKKEIEIAIANIKTKKFNITDISSKVVSRNPYGAGEHIVNGEAPILTKPNQRGSSFDPPPVPIEKPAVVQREDPKKKRKGMSTNLGLMNSGPLRDISPL